MVNRQQSDLLIWMGDRLVTLGDISDYFRLDRSLVSKMVKELIEMDLIEPSGSHRKAVNGYPMVLYQRTDEVPELDEGSPIRPMEWKPLWNQMGLGEAVSLSGTPTIHRLEE